MVISFPFHHESISNCLSCKGYFIMAIGGFNGGEGDLDNVELVSLDPTSQPVPDCLTQLGPVTTSVRNAAGALDLNRER